MALPADYLQSTSVSSSDSHQYLRVKCSGECGMGQEHGRAVCRNEGCDPVPNKRRISRTETV